MRRSEKDSEHETGVSRALSWEHCRVVILILLLAAGRDIAARPSCNRGRHLKLNTLQETFYLPVWLCKCEDTLAARRTANTDWDFGSDLRAPESNPCGGGDA